METIGLSDPYGAEGLSCVRCLARKAAASAHDGGDERNLVAMMNMEDLRLCLKDGLRLELRKFYQWEDDVPSIEATISFQGEVICQDTVRL